MPIAEAHPSTTVPPGSGNTLSYVSEETQSIFGKIDLGTIQQSVSKSIPLTFRLKSFSCEQHGVLDRILEAYLSELGLEGIQETLSYCTKELLVNAQKAAAKRVYFQKKGLSITDPDDYKKGMRQFLHYLTKSAAEGSQEQTETDEGIALTIQSTGGMFIIKVSNKGELTQEEYSRISDRMLKARGFSSFYEALNSVRDVTEGAGLGIVILIQFLKRIVVFVAGHTTSIAEGMCYRGGTPASLNNFPIDTPLGTSM